VRRVFRWPLVLLLGVAVVSGALLAFLVTDTGYDVTCCTQADIDRPWQPGTTVELHWTVETDSPNLPDRVFDRFENPTHKVSITAVLSGPYSDRAAVNHAIQQGPTGDIPTVTVLGSVTAMDDRTRPSTAPVTTFVLPADLPAGYYDLTLLWEDGNGGIGDPRNIVRVGTQ
jgi:hypothetical protein